MSDTVDSLKQRLVGAFVILSLAVIFLPMLFDKPHREGSAEVEQVPPKPTRETVVISRPTKPDYEKRVVVSEQGAKEESRLPKLVAAQSEAKNSVEDVASSDGASGIVTTSEQEKEALDSSAEQKEGASRVVETKVYSNVWMVQLGTFSKRENAYALRDRLRELGVNGHTKPVKSSDAIRVFAGPYVTKKEALRIKRKLDAEFKVDSLVVFFEA